MAGTDAGGSLRFGDGTAGLDVMESAPRYNTAIEDDIVRAIGLPTATKRVLDVGAGKGEFSRRLRDRGYAVTCVEVSPDHVAELRASGFEVHASIEDVPSGAAFDAAILVNVLEHIEQDATALRAIAEQLRPGGRLFVWVPAFEVLYSDHDYGLGHFRRYRRETLERVVRIAGFRIVDSGYRDSLGWAAALAWRLRPRRGEATEPSASSVALYDRLLFPVSSAVDRVAHPVIGKNVIVTAERP